MILTLIGIGMLILAGSPTTFCTLIKGEYYI